MTWSEIRSGGFFKRLKLNCLIQQAAGWFCWKIEHPGLVFGEADYVESNEEVGFDDFDDGTINSRAAILDHF